MTEAAVHALEGVFPGDSEMARLMRQADWANTPLGAAEFWPQSLKSAVSILLSSKAEIVLFWGPDLVALYNDAYAPTFGSKHPSALGRPARDCWSEVWDVIGPLFQNVMQSGEAFWAKAHPFLLHRHGYLEETYYDVSYDPVRAEGGAIGGVFCIVSEKTGEVIGERRLRLLREIAADTANARSAEEACLAASPVLEAHSEDVPFSLVYRLDGSAAHLVASSGIEAGTAASPVDVRADDPSWWPAERAIRGARQDVVRHLNERFGPLPGGPWDVPADSAMLLPLTSGSSDGVWGLLIAGVSPRRELDEDYESFLTLVAGQVSSAIASAQAYEDERKRAESLAELDRAKTLFFSNVSHEFRTPLTLMMGPLESVLASKELQGTSVEASLEIAYRNSLRLLRLVNTLLDFSRIESGRIEAVYERTDVAELTRDLASGFRSAVERAGLRLAVECETPSQEVFLDRDMWEKIVLNLLSNALKFTFEGEIRVSLRESEGWIELAVQDTGSGIPRTEIDRVFERFHRIRGARARTHEGSGIGLALVQELTKLHGGEVMVESRYGSGSTFRVRIPTGSAHLPREKIGAARTSMPTASGTEAFVAEAMRWLDEQGDGRPEAGLAGDVPYRIETGPPGHGVPATVLVADDNADMRDYLVKLLREHWNVIAAADGVAALREAREKQVDLVIADVMMPGMDGFELLSALRGNEATATLPVIMLSARAGEEARIEGVAAGADDYLVKPFSARELIARVKTHLALAAARREREEAIRESERRYAELLGSLGLAVYTTDADGVLTYYNEAAAELWGRRPEIGVDMWCGSWRILDAAGNVIPLDQCPMAVALKERRPVRGVEAIAQRPDGSRVWFAPYPTPLHDSGGAVIGAVNVLVDITERKQAEVELAKVHEQLLGQTEVLRTVQGVGEAVAGELNLSRAVQSVTDAATRLTDAECGSFFYNVTNPAGEQQMLYAQSGADQGRIEGPGLPGTTPLFKLTFEDAMTLRVADVEEHPDFGVAPMRQGGTAEQLPVRSYLAVPVVGRSGEVLGGLFFTHSKPGMFTETHEELAHGVAHWAALALENARLYESTLEAAEQVRRQREDLYSMLMQSPLPMAVFRGPELVWELANAHAIAAIGRADLAGKPLLAAVPEFENLPLVQELRSVLETGQPVTMTEQPMRLRRAGELRDTYWNYAFAPLRERDGRIERVMAVAFEVTEQVLARRQMEEAIAIKDQFLGLVSHELRTPISTVIANALLLRRRGDQLAPEDRAQALDDIASQGDKLQRLIENLLTLTRLEATSGPEFRPVELHEVVEEQVEAFARQNARRQVVTQQDGAMVAVQGQKDLLAIVIGNLIGNADKYSPPDAQIEVLLKANDSAEVEVRVRDYGIGVEEAEVASLFVPFYRTRTARSYAPGMGLGLAVCKRIVDAHGGRIWARRRPEGGSDFVFTLPIVMDT